MPGRQQKGDLNVRKQVSLLVELQQIDLKLDQVEEEKSGVVARAAELGSQLEKARAALAIRSEELAAIQSQQKEIAANLDLENENVDRSEKRLKEIKTQKEYQAVSKEIGTAKKLLEELAEQQEAKASEIALLEAEVDEKSLQLAELEANIVDRQAECAAEIAAIETGAAGEIADRERVTKEIPASLLRRYSMLREQRRGVAVVEARDGSCLGCNMHIPPQMYNNLYKGNEMICCPHCQRVLYLLPPAQ